MTSSYRSFISMALAIALGAMPPSFVSAEDTDLFVGSPPNATAGRPNVLFILDNSANWNAQSQHWTDGSAQGESELRALRKVVGNLKVNTDNTGTINVGLMMFTPGSGQNKDGGYVRFHIREMNATNKLRLQEQLGLDGCTYDKAANLNSLTGTPNCIIGGFSVPTSTGGEMTATADTDYSAALFEAFKYFGGFTDPANANVQNQDAHLSNQGPSEFGPYRYAGDPDNKSDPAAFVDGGAPSYPGIGGSREKYIPPISSDNNCADNYIIFIGNGFPVTDAPSTLLSGVLGSTTQLSMPQVSTTQSESIIHQGLSGSTCQTSNECVSTLQSAFTGADNYTCTAGTSTTSTGCTGSSRKDWDTKVSNTVFSVTFPPTGTASVPSNNEARFADEWAKYLFTTDVNGSPTDDVAGQLGAPGQQKVTIFTIDVFKDNQDERQTRLLYNMAKVSGGEYYQATSEAAIEDALNEALTKIQAKNAVFAAASLPVSATNRAQNENQVFFGMFRPDGVAQPRWYGNLKRYQVARDANNELVLAGTNTDAQGKPVSAVNTLSGFFDPCATSFWTTDTSNFNTTTTPPTAYWAFLGSARAIAPRREQARFPTCPMDSLSRKAARLKY